MFVYVDYLFTLSDETQPIITSGWLGVHIEPSKSRKAEDSLASVY